MKITYLFFLLNLVLFIDTYLYSDSLDTLVINGFNCFDTKITKPIAQDIVLIISKNKLINGQNAITYGSGFILSDTEIITGLHVILENINFSIYKSSFDNKLNSICSNDIEEDTNEIIKKAPIYNQLSLLAKKSCLPKIDSITLYLLKIDKYLTNNIAANIKLIKYIINMNSIDTKDTYSIANAIIKKYKQKLSSFNKNKLPNYFLLDIAKIKFKQKIRTNISADYINIHQTPINQTPKDLRKYKNKVGIFAGYSHLSSLNTITANLYPTCAFFPASESIYISENNQEYDLHENDDKIASQDNPDNSKEQKEQSKTNKNIENQLNSQIREVLEFLTNTFVLTSGIKVNLLKNAKKRKKQSLFKLLYYINFRNIKKGYVFFGDSGGPFIGYDKSIDKYFLIGLFSFGYRIKNYSFTGILNLNIIFNSPFVVEIIKK